MICVECHTQLIASARAALSVLADSDATPSDRQTAADVLEEDARWLARPVGSRESRS